MMKSQHNSYPTLPRGLVPIKEVRKVYKDLRRYARSLGWRVWAHGGLVFFSRDDYLFAIADLPALHLGGGWIRVYPTEADDVERAFRKLRGSPRLRKQEK